MAGTAEVAWMEAEGGYAVALRGGQVVARGPRGSVLKSVPAALRDSDVVRQLRELRDWLKRHERDCLATVESWMVRSLPVPTSVLYAVWPDPAWQRALRDTVVLPLDAAGEPIHAATGFLRNADAQRGIGVVTLDGETVFATVQRLVLPHPVNLRELDDFRDFASELQVEQAIPQLYRETFTRPVELSPQATRVSEFGGGTFQQLLFATGRARTLGFQVSGGSAVTKIWEAGNLVEARYWIGSDQPAAEAWTGDLTWVDSAATTLPLGQVGPVAYSEGMRMASSIYAGRGVEGTGEA